MNIEDLPKDMNGRPNMSYLGHTSDIIPTPWPWEGRKVVPGMPRRFPIRKVRTRAEEAERKRLAAIENPGKCQSRRDQTDGWCQWPCSPGLNVCWVHGGRIKHIRAAGARRVAEQKLLEKAQKIADRAKA